MKFIALVVATIMCCCGIGTTTILLNSDTIIKAVEPIDPLENAVIIIENSIPMEGIGRPNNIPYYSGVTEDELETVAILTYLEAGAECNVLIQCTVEVIFNRLQSGIWGNTLTDVIYAPGEFEPVYLIANFNSLCDLTVAEKMNEIREIVRDVYMNGSSLPERIMFFRTDYYHEWPGAVPEFAIGNVYFSSSIWCEG